MFQAFLDESGTHDGSPVVVVAGYMARPTQWKHFTRRWKRVLKPSGIEVFHSVDCNGFRGEFAGWDKKSRDDLVAKLLPIIPDEKRMGVAIGIVLRDYEEALRGKEHLRSILGSPYETCFQWWLSSVINESRKYGSTEPIAVIHEQNQFQVDAQRAFNYLKEQYDDVPLISLTFASKQEFVPLQAADILAYDVGKLLLNQSGKPRRSFEVLSPEGRRPRIRFYDKENMPALIAQMETYRQLLEQEKLSTLLNGRPL